MPYKLPNDIGYIYPEVFFVSTISGGRHIYASPYTETDTVLGGVLKIVILDDQLKIRKKYSIKAESMPISECFAYVLYEHYGILHLLFHKEYSTDMPSQRHILNFERNEVYFVDSEYRDGLSACSKKNFLAAYVGVLCREGGSFLIYGYFSNRRSQAIIYTLYPRDRLAGSCVTGSVLRNETENLSFRASPTSNCITIPFVGATAFKCFSVYCGYGNTLGKKDCIVRDDSVSPRGCHEKYDQRPFLQTIGNIISLSTYEKTAGDFVIVAGTDEGFLYFLDAKGLEEAKILNFPDASSAKHLVAINHAGKNFILAASDTAFHCYSEACQHLFSISGFSFIQNIYTVGASVLILQQDNSCKLIDISEDLSRQEFSYQAEGTITG